MKHYRARIPLIVALFMVAVQVILLFSCYAIAVGTREQFAEESFEIQCYDVKNKVESTLKQLEAVIKATENSRFTVYSEGTTATITEDEVADLSTSVYQYIESLDIPEEMVDSIIIMSTTYTKSGYIKRIGGNGIVSTMLPNMAQMKLVGMDLWEKNRNLQWNYYQKGSLERQFQKAMEQNGRNISDQIQSNVSYFLSLLDGKIVMSARSPYGGSRIFVTVRQDFLSSLLKADERVNLALFKDGLPVYSNASYRVYGPQIAEKDAEWVSSVGIKNYNNRSFTLENSEFDLVVNAPVENVVQEIALVEPLVWVALGGVTLGVVVSFVLTLVLLHPIRRLTRRFDEQFKNGSYRELGKNGRFLRWPMFYRVLAIMVISVMVPCIITGFFYQNRLNDFVWDTNAKYLEQVSEAVSENVSKKMEYIRFYSSIFPEEVLVTYLEGAYQSDASLKEKLNSVYGEIDSFAGYALFDREGKQKYASRTAYGQQVLDKDMIPTSVENEKKLVWEGLAVDNSRKDGRTQPALVHVLYHMGESGREVAGYMVFYLNMTHFYDLRPNVGHEFTITGPEERILFSSVSDNSDLYDRLAGESTDQDGEYQLIREPDGIFGGEIVTYNDMRYYQEQAERLSYSYMLVFFLSAALFVVATLMLSRRLSHPLEIMVEDMRGMGDIQEITPIRYFKRDEISLLVESYNRMVARMASLIEENARRINRENELIALNTRTELQMLQQQINPHLLYNTLEFIRYHANAEGKTAAGDMAMALADFFRYTTSVKDDIVSFADELNHVKNYIQIHRLRYGERFETVYHISEEALNCRVVKFILQPFVENVFKYGIANKLHGALITVTAYVEDDVFYVALEDNGIGMRPAKFAELQTRVKTLLAGGDVDKPGDNSTGGVGMANVARRLRMYYGEKAVLELHSEFMRGFRVLIAIPAEIRKPEKEEFTEK